MDKRFLKRSQRRLEHQGDDRLLRLDAVVPIELLAVRMDRASRSTPQAAGATKMVPP
jgi:hypothetical protein